MVTELASVGFSWDTGNLAVVMTFAIPLVAIVGGLWYAIATKTAEMELKRSMVERGMSVDEIERVLAAKSSK